MAKRDGKQIGQDGNDPGRAGPAHGARGPVQQTGSRGREATRRSDAPGFQNAPAHVSAAGLPDSRPLEWNVGAGAPRSVDASTYRSNTADQRDKQREPNGKESTGGCGIDLSHFKSGRE